MKKFIDCAREDVEQMKAIEEGLNIVIGHKLFNGEEMVVTYRGHTFTVKCKGEIEN